MKTIKLSLTPVEAQYVQHALDILMINEVQSADRARNQGDLDFAEWQMQNAGFCKAIYAKVQKAREKYAG